MSKLIITERPEKWQIDIADVHIVTPTEYFKNPKYQEAGTFKVVNLCKSYQYQSLGYYVSLLAEARGHKVLPKVATLQEFRFPSIMREDAEGFDEMIQKVFSTQATTKIEIDICFGFTKEKEFNKIGLLLFNLYEVPLLRSVFVMKEKKWMLQSLKPLNLRDLSSEERLAVNTPLGFYLMGKQVVRNYTRKKFDLAIMVNPLETTPPSDARALQKFVKAADKVGFNTEIITKNDYAKLIQFDALFIRETTNVNHYTFRFAKKAENEGLVVIDDPESILKCTNKVYLSELLNTNNIAAPKTKIIQKVSSQEDLAEFQYPFILKQPDGSFSKGVKKVEDAKELNIVLKDLFLKSDLLIAQEFFPTEFDWRVGIMDGKTLYVCKYFMAPKHWQVMDWNSSGKLNTYGDVETIAVADAPKGLIEIAEKAAGLIGTGLYGVDVKERDGKFYIIEVNDNPSIDDGTEDRVIKSELYTSIMQSIMNRLL